MKKVWVIIKREYLVRVRSRAFLFGTIVSPLFLLGLILLPAILAERTSRGQRQITVLDQSGDPQLFAAIKQRVELRGSGPDAGEGSLPARSAGFVLSLRLLSPDQNPNDFIRQDSNGEGDKAAEKAYLILSPGVLDGVEPEYHARNLSDFAIRSLEESVSGAISERRLMRAGFDATRIGSYMKPVDLRIFKIGAGGESKQGGVRQEFMVAFALLFFLYISVLFYGIFTMRGVIEEKQSRIIEILISSVKPTQMMLGKLVGIGLVGLTQIGIWAISTALISRIGASMFAATGSQIPSIPTSLLVYFVAFFVLGFFLYATLYAMVGAIVSNEEDAQQVQFPVTMLVVMPMMIFGVVMSNPNSTLSIVLSMVPFFAPTLMMLRIAVINPPVWQVVLSMLIMVVTILGFLWVAAKIYRVGILMYGKRPSIAELGRWLRYT
ncbi:MAG TPA: ABC transporter permease [Blastocatellia bacterium]|nr:ABC transporter permease [Blastocatellia bacterium]